MKIILEIQKKKTKMFKKIARCQLIKFLNFENYIKKKQKKQYIMSWVWWKKKNQNFQKLKKKKKNDMSPHKNLNF